MGEHYKMEKISQRNGYDFTICQNPVRNLMQFTSQSDASYTLFCVRLQRNLTQITTCFDRSQNTVLLDVILCFNRFYVICWFPIWRKLNKNIFRIDCNSICIMPLSFKANHIHCTENSMSRTCKYGQSFSSYAHKSVDFCQYSIWSLHI